jgi:hypothetical protein
MKLEKPPRFILGGTALLLIYTCRAEEVSNKKSQILKFSNISTCSATLFPA